MATCYVPGPAVGTGKQRYPRCHLERVQACYVEGTGMNRGSMVQTRDKWVQDPGEHSRGKDDHLLNENRAQFRKACSPK